MRARTRWISWFHLKKVRNVRSVRKSLMFGENLVFN